MCLRGSAELDIRGCEALLSVGGACVKLYSFLKKLWDPVIDQMVVILRGVRIFRREKGLEFYRMKGC